MKFFGHVHAHSLHITHNTTTPIHYACNYRPYDDDGTGRGEVALHAAGFMVLIHYIHACIHTSVFFVD